MIHDPWPLNGADTNLGVYYRQNYVFSWLAIYDGEPTCNAGASALRNEQPALESTSLPIINRNKGDLTNAVTSARNSTSTVDGSAILYHVYETSLVVQLSAQSAAGNVTEMQVWTDSIESPTWKPFEPMVWLPWNPGDQIYARFRDEHGNESVVYGDSLQPLVGPSDAPDLDEQVLLPVVIGSKN